MKLRITILLFFFITSLTAQNFNLDYSPFNVTDDKSKVLARIQARYDRDIKKLGRKDSKEIKKIYTTRYNNLTADVKEGLYINDDEVNDYFNNVLNEIFEYNPSIRNQDIRLLVSRSPIPNASCTGEGTIIINIGLLNRLENESQIAFILCHEIAHYSKNHVNRSIVKYVRKRYSRETKQELKRISKEKYNKTMQALELLKDFVYDSRRHSRTHEEEADAIALEYLLNTRYDARAAMSCLNILDHVDKEKYRESLALNDIFNHTEYPYKERWEKEEDLISIEKNSDDDDFNSDSLKTHPDCQKRAYLLKQSLANYNGTGRQLFVQNKKWFANFKIACDFEIVAQSYEYGNLAYSMYYAIQLLKQYPDNVYLQAIVGKIFYRYEQARNRHEGSKYVPLVSKDFEKPMYNLILFFNNLRTRELSKIAYHFLSKTKEKHLSNEDFLFACYVHAKRGRKIEEAAQLKRLYFERFPDGKFKEAVDKINPFE